MASKGTTAAIELPRVGQDRQEPDEQARAKATLALAEALRQVQGVLTPREILAQAKALDHPPEDLVGTFAGFGAVVAVFEGDRLLHVEYPPGPNHRRWRNFGDERGQLIGGVAVQRMAAPIVAAGGARVGVAGGVLDFAQRHAGVQRRRPEPPETFAVLELPVLPAGGMPS
jgi:hypothetical protein